ncbi:rhodanese-like domain-containing protein [Thiohalocapsa marina]|uniref:Rhodanese-like domain-containing protein n=1 Tax=Thiohalocapsa marina TaxID=424902 RepID=A0A5M8FQ16_9GAMM|nr:rhodanese-like domain-containing protein [Thiohalocapsa marina]KAA6184535.1 rhodanese-like domain-containing protein [Thiohalocapsa marina]
MYDLSTPETPLTLMDFVEAAKSRVKELSPQQLQQLQHTTDDLLVVDVRESSEHEQGHLANAMLVPRGILEAAADPTYEKHLPRLTAHRDRPIVLYCATGGRSAMGAAVLQMMGFKSVYSLAGGITGWEGEGLPINREARYV